MVSDATREYRPKSRKNKDGDRFLDSRTKSVYFGVVKKQILLRKHEDGRILQGHQWVFSNEIASVRGTPEAGDVVEILRSDERFLGIGFYHPHSLIAVRVLSTADDVVDQAFFERRISIAERMRRRIYPGFESFRLVHGESDYLPGLVIDKYNEVLVLQAFSAGMERRLPMICDALESLYHPRAIVARNDLPMRTLEQLPLENQVLRGTAEPTIIEEYGVKFKVDPLRGQKTGFFLDQRENRRRAMQYMAGRTVLDCFCNEGGFSMHTAAGHARAIEGIDASADAIANAQVNATLNSVTSAAFATADAFDRLREYQTERRRFDAIILDPPSFTRSKKTVATALKGYRQINYLALTLVNPEGILVTASCSHHIGEDDFLGTVQRAANKAQRKVQLLEFHGAAPDHPTLPAMPETTYLKFAIFSVL